MENNEIKTILMDEVVSIMSDLIQSGIKGRTKTEPMVVRKSDNEKPYIVDGIYTLTDSYNESISGSVYKHTISYVYCGHIVDVHIMSSNVGATDDQNNYLFIDVFRIDNDMNEYLVGSIKYEVYHLESDRLDLCILPGRHLEDKLVDFCNTDEAILQCCDRYVRSLYLSGDVNKPPIFKHINEIINFLINDYYLRLDYKKFININRAYFLNTMILAIIAQRVVFYNKHIGYNADYLNLTNESKFELDLSINLFTNAEYTTDIIKVEDTLIDEHKSKLKVLFGTRYGYGSGEVKTRLIARLLDSITYTINYHYDGKVTFVFDKRLDSRTSHLFSNDIETFDSINTAIIHFSNSLESELYNITNNDTSNLQ